MQRLSCLEINDITVPEIRMATTNYHDISSIRKWIHRFNNKGIEGIISRMHAYKLIRINAEMEKKIEEEIPTNDPMKDYGQVKQGKRKSSPVVPSKNTISISSSNKKF